MAVKDGAFVVLFKDNTKQEVFLVLRSDYFIWNLPGGGIEKGEKPNKAAIREVLEETGFVAKLTRHVCIYQFVDKNGSPTRKNYLYEGKILSGEFKPEFPGCQGKWFGVRKLPLDLTKQHKERIMDAIKFKENEIVITKPERGKWYNWHLLFIRPKTALKYLLKK